MAKRVPAVALRRADRDRGRYDAPSVEQLGAYSEVQGYDESIRPGLRETIERFAPETIALNYSPSDPAADGLTHGLWLVLLETLEGTLYADRLVSSKPIVGSLRGRKSSFEVARIRAAIAETEEIFAHAGDRIGPGLEGDRDRRGHAGRSFSTRSRLRVGGGALPGRQRRSGEGRRSHRAD